MQRWGSHLVSFLAVKTNLKIHKRSINLVSQNVENTNVVVELKVCHGEFRWLGIDKHNKWVESKKKKKKNNADIYHFPGNQMKKLNSMLTFIQWEEPDMSNGRYEGELKYKNV